MGVVKRQGGLSTIVIYIGVIIGYLNAGIFMPKFLTPSEIGVRGLLVDFTIVFTQFVFFGIQLSIVKFSDYYKKGDKIEGAFLFFLFLSSLSFLLFSGILYLSEEYVKSYFLDKSPFFLTVFKLVYVLSFAMVLNMLVEAILRSIHNIVFITFYKNVVHRLIFSALLYVFFIEVINFEQLILGFVISYFVIFLAGFVYLLHHDKIDFNIDRKLIQKDFIFKLSKFSAFSFLSSSAGMVVLKVDTIMIGAMLISTTIGDSTYFVGLYVIAVFFVTMIEIPKRAVFNINNPLVSQFISQNNWGQVNVIYKKTSDLLGVLGLFLYGCLIINFDSIINFMPNGDKYESIFPVILILGLSRVVIMYFSVNNEIIIFSKYYKYQTVFVTGLAFLSIILNYILIDKYGLNGAALASLISLSVFSLIKYYFIKSKFNLSLFSIKTLIHLLTTLLMVGFLTYLPIGFNFFMNTVLKSGFFLLFYLVFTYKINLSKMFNDSIDKQLLNRLK